VLRGGALAAGAVTFGAACSSASPAAAPVAPAQPTSAPAAGAAATATPAPPPKKYGGTVRLAVSGAAPHLDVHQTATFSLHSQGPSVVYSRLIRYKIGEEKTSPGLAPTPDLAASWDAPDELTYIFKIRPGVKWQNMPPVNGREFQAQDVLFSYDRQRAMKVNGDLLAAIGKWEAPDKNTVKLTLSKPDADFLISLAEGHNVIIAHEVIDLKGDLKEGPTIGTGPYILEKWDPDVGTFVVKNPDYYIKGVPYVDRYERVRIPDEGVRQTALRSKQLDTLGFGITPPDAKKLQDQYPQLKRTDTQGSGSGIEMGLKADMAPFNDIRVRQAVSKAIDRQAVVDTVFFGLGWLSAGVTLPGVDWAIPEAEAKQLFQRDVAAAKKLLADANLANGFEFELQVANYGQTTVSSAELVAAQLKDIGVTAKLRTITPAEYNQQVIVEKNYVAYVANTQPVPTANGDLVSRHRTGGGRNHFGYSDPKLDDQIDKQAVLTKDPDGRKKALLDIQRAIVNSAHLIMLQTSKGIELTWDHVKNYDPMTTGADLMPTALLWLDK
jgi:peptide/nickel transport system substrate-binding protein